MTNSSDDDLHPPKKNASEIYSVDLQTKGGTTMISGRTNTYPSYSPDGRKIAFRRMIGDMNSEVFVAWQRSEDLTNHMGLRWLAGVVA